MISDHVAGPGRFLIHALGGLGLVLLCIGAAPGALLLWLADKLDDCRAERAIRKELFGGNE